MGMAKLHALASSTSRTRVLGPPPRAAAGLFLLRSPPAPGLAVHTTGRCSENLTPIHSASPSSGHITRYYHHHSIRQHLPEPCPSGSGPFSSTTPVRKWKPSATPAAHASPAVPDQISAASPSPSSPTLRPHPTAGLVLRRPGRPMAYNTYSTASSDISTPRSSSPSSVFSGRSSHTTVASKRLSLSLQRRQSAFNPMSTVDIASIEQRMKMASLDGLRGYAQDHYGEVKQDKATDYVPKSAAGGYQVLREPLWNKGVHLLSPFF